MTICVAKRSEIAPPIAVDQAKWVRRQKTRCLAMMHTMHNLGSNEEGLYAQNG